METTDRNYEYKVISGSSKKWDALDAQLNVLANDGWEVFQSSACQAGGFGFGLAMGTGGGGGGMQASLVIVLRRPKS